MYLQELIADDGLVDGMHGVLLAVTHAQNWHLHANPKPRSLAALLGRSRTHLTRAFDYITPHNAYDNWSGVHSLRATGSLTAPFPLD